MKLWMDDMRRRGYNPDIIWENAYYRGKTLGYQQDWCSQTQVYEIACLCRDGSAMIYPEHNKEYLQECLDNLKEKGVEIDVNLLQNS